MTSDKKLQDIYSNFVTASTSNVFSYPKHVSEKNTGQLGRMSGEEAKSFYEDVVFNDKNGGQSYDKPQDNHHRIVTQRTTSSSSICEQSSARKPAPQEKRSKTVSKVFRYAQEGNLSELKKALYSARHSPVDINVKDKFLWTPLMCSAHAGHASVVNFLLGEGAVWRNTCDQKGNSALDLARLAGHSDVETILLEHEKLKKDSGALFRAATYPSKTKCNKKFWCSHCQQEFTEDKRKHEASTAHLFNCQHKSKKTIYAIPESSIGYQMMITSGWDAEKGLGRDGNGRKFPVKTVLKRDRLGLGCNKKQSRITHFGPKDELAVKSPRVTKQKPQKLKRQTNKHQLQVRTRNEKQWELNMRRYMSSFE